MATGLDFAHAVKAYTDAKAGLDAATAARAASGSLSLAARTARFVPVPARPVVTTTPAESIFPVSVSSDGLTLYGRYGSRVMESTDEGANWTEVYAFPGFVERARVMTNGALLVSCRGPAGEPGEMWTNSGGSWERTLQSSTSTSYFQSEWGMSVAGGNRIIVSEYGTKMPAAEVAPRRVWMSEDFGQTWTVVFDLGNVEDGHIHGSAWDPYWDRIWVVTGDSVNRGIHYSDDLGQTWTVASRDYQPVGILPMRDCVLLTTDDAVNGILRIPRVDKNAHPTIEVAYVVEQAKTLVTLGSAHYQHTPDSPAYFPFNRAGAGHSYLIATKDGTDFYELWKSPEPYPNPGNGLLGVVPVASGNLVGFTSDPNGAQLVTLKEPEWRPRPIDQGRVATRKFARPSTQGVAVLDGTVGGGLPGLDVRAAVTHPTWPVSGILAGRYLGSDGNREWFFGTTADGRLEFIVFPTHLNASRTTFRSTASVDVRPGRITWLRGSLEITEGSATATFRQSHDGGQTWTEVGTPRVAAMEGLPSALPHIPLTFGSGVGATLPWGGDVYYCAVSGNADGSDPVAWIDFNDPQWSVGDEIPGSIADPAPVYVDGVGNQWGLAPGAKVMGYPTLEGAASTLKPAVSGAIADGTALQSLLDALHTLSLVDADGTVVGDDRIIYGTGSPLGVVSAPPGTKYIDEVGTLGAWEWLKKSGTGNTGWEVIHGDTGPRMIPSSMLENGWTHGDSNNGLILRRINAEVIFMSNYVGSDITLDNTNATGIRFLTLPDGFRKMPSANYSTVGFAKIASANGVLLTDPAHGMAVVAGGAKGYASFNVNWTTTDPWPTVLPGTAV